MTTAISASGPGTRPSWNDILLTSVRKRQSSTGTDSIETVNVNSDQQSSFADRQFLVTVLPAVGDALQACKASTVFAQTARVVNRYLTYNVTAAGGACNGLTLKFAETRNFYIKYVNKLERRLTRSAIDLGNDPSIPPPGSDPTQPQTAWTLPTIYYTDCGVKHG